MAKFEVKGESSSPVFTDSHSNISMHVPLLSQWIPLSSLISSPKIFLTKKGLHKGWPTPTKVIHFILLHGVMITMGLELHHEYHYEANSWISVRPATSSGLLGHVPAIYLLFRILASYPGPFFGREWFSYGEGPGYEAIWDIYSGRSVQDTLIECRIL